ncbi:MAG: acetylglutamate kinase [Deltaproteobacteria bacterium]|nr:acetylglutamate kinase [Deltaproteobacteria bacterium]MBW2071915.1 acetylglutamate kinase [Deltaproteobacteria bacterium]
MDVQIEKASVLIEALPYIREFYQKNVVVKYGGSAMVQDQLKRCFAQDIVLLKYIGINPIVVHGGGPQIGKTLERLGKKSEFRQGMRITDSETMDVVEMVLVGKVNKEIVALINQQGGQAVGLSGKDGRLIKASKLHLYSNHKNDKPPELIDLGMVGQVDHVQPEIIQTLEASRFIPIIAPVGVDEHGQTYNINADLVAGKVATALQACKLILLTDVPGVLDASGELISSMSVAEASELLEKGVLGGGMIPKVKCAVEAVKGGVAKAHIIDGRIEHALLLEIFMDRGVGTEITGEVEEGFRKNG